MLFIYKSMLNYFNLQYPVNFPKRYTAVDTKRSTINYLKNIFLRIIYIMGVLFLFNFMR